MSGTFRKLLTYLINDMHNSNLLLRQITLSGEIIEEEKFGVLGFVAINVVGLRKEVWFSKLSSKQIANVEKCLNEHAANHM